MQKPLNAVASALECHPRTLLRITTGQPNPYWADGFNPEVDTDLICAATGGSPALLERIMDEEDSVLTVDEAAHILKLRPAEFYRMEIVPDFQVGRVKRYSLQRISAMAKK